MTIRDTGMLTPPTPERLKKSDVGVMLGDRGGKEIRSFSHPLDFYLKRDWITRPQRDIGTQYGELWEIGYHRSQHAQSRYGDPLNRGAYNPHHADECRDKYDRASLVLRNMETRKLVFNVCCLGYKAGIGRIVELRGALDELDKHFYRNGSVK